MSYVLDMLFVFCPKAVKNFQKTLKSHSLLELDPKVTVTCFYLNQKFHLIILNFELENTRVGYLFFPLYFN